MQKETPLTAHEIDERCSHGKFEKLLLIKLKYCISTPIKITGICAAKENNLEVIVKSQRVLYTEKFFTTI